MFDWEKGAMHRAERVMLDWGLVPQAHSNLLTVLSSAVWKQAVHELTNSDIYESEEHNSVGNKL